MEALSKSRMAISATAVLTIALLATSAHTTKTSASSPQPLPEVKVATVEQRDVPMYREWIGTLDGLVNAAIKAQVTGYLLSQDYTEGSFVRTGQLLFEIDRRPFQAALDQPQGQLAMARGQLAQAKAQLAQAQAQLAQSVANQQRAQMDVDKYAPLAKQQALRALRALS
jgi:membrane fusion protein (multidrug efflux system)